MRRRRKKINLENLPSNNQTAPNRRTPVETRGTISKGSRTSNLANEVRNIANALFQEIVMPDVTSTGLQFLFTAIESIVYRNQGFGQQQPRRQFERRSYNRAYQKPRGGRTMRMNRGRIGARQIQEPQLDIFEDYYYGSRADAEAVLQRMKEYVLDYGIATVGDLYSTIGVSYTVADQRYGWDDLSRVGISYTADGYIINFPDAIYIN